MPLPRLPHIDFQDYKTLTHPLFLSSRLRKRFDPREIHKLMEHRNECARAAAARFAEELAEGRLDYRDEAFGQVCYNVLYVNHV